jgi:PilZ domain-containing protein
MKFRSLLHLERTSTLVESASPSPLLSATCRRSREPLLVQKPSYSRRALTRLLASEDIWVCWRCSGRDDVSRVLDISIDGLFIQTPHLKVKEGMSAKLDFLVQEGRIKADAVVRHVKGGSGLGLRFVAVADEDRQRLKALLSRLRSQHTKPPTQPLRNLGQE